MCIFCDRRGKRNAEDADGNLTNYNGWTFEWDAENRLIFASNGTTVVQNVYDYMSRRVKKVVNGVTNEFVYDGWNFVLERRAEASAMRTNYYVWGLDLSGSLQRAGGIGGLLAPCFGGTTSVSSVFYTYDANGNVTDLLETNGSGVAHYEYDPYGNLTAAEGTETQANPFRFSTKYADDETGLVYYGYRFYSPVVGRWLSRDPLAENSFIAVQARSTNMGYRRHAGNNVYVPVYVFVLNEPVGATDWVGLQLRWFRCGGECIPEFGYGGLDCCGDEENGIVYNQIDECCYQEDPPIVGHYESRANCEFEGSLHSCMANCLAGPCDGPPWLCWGMIAGCFAWCVMPVCCL